MQQKKIPQRQCMGCRERREKRELIRVVRAPDGGVSLDFRGKAPGRGAYICPDMACLKKAIRSKALERSLEASPFCYGDVWKERRNLLSSRGNIKSDQLSPRRWTSSSG